MKLLKSILAAALMAAAPAWAGNGEGPGAIDLLVDETGMTHREVRLVVSAPPAFLEYRTRYDAASRQFQRALGAERYRALMRGERVVLGNGGYVQRSRDGGDLIAYHPREWEVRAE